MVKLIMLGTGHAMVTKCYNTCFVIDHDNSSIMIDAGGGNGILTQVEKAGLENRTKKYTKEAMQSFKGNIFVPDDLETIQVI